MCIMKGSDDGRVLLDLDLLAFLCFMFSSWLFGSKSFGGIFHAVFLHNVYILGEEYKVHLLCKSIIKIVF